jgi:hypothetical protein
MTLIDGINRMLRYLGELPIPDDVVIDDLPEGHEAVMARKILLETNREEQENRWWFNWFKQTYIPNATGYITIGGNVIALEASNNRSRYLLNGGDLYDVDNQTKNFTSPVELKVLLNIRFEDLPSVFKTYVVLVAAKHLHVYLNGDETTQRELEIKIQEQRNKLDKEDMKFSNYNLIKGSKLIDRGSNPQPLI